MSLIKKFVDWLFDSKEPKQEIPQIQAPAITDIENVKEWVNSNDDHQELITYYRYAIANNADASTLRLIKTRLIYVCEKISPTLLDRYFPPE